VSTSVLPTSVTADPGPISVDADRFERAVQAIDAANAADPNTIEIDGVARPKELAHAELMTAWVRRLDPTATEAQLLAARAHHLRRWIVPRSDYPEGRAGYLRWRADAKKRHAADVADILVAQGYDDETIERVQAIVRKDSLRTDAAVQVHEDALCLVFLETQLHGVVDQLGADKGADVLRKTLRKMSPRGQAEAREVTLAPEDRATVIAALEEVGG
jgi:hypothetical protein